MATVIPYTNNTTVTTTVKSASPVLPRKPPLTLQESGIFEEEYDEDEEGSEVELASRGTQTQVPSGELLQEVQRLQELRARIQERAAKTPGFHLIDSSKICLDVSTMDSIVQLTAYQERVRDLEERLEAHEETEKNRVCEKQLSKQREEELLDENYRLTERIYWLENELRNVAETNSDARNAASESDTTVAERNDNVQPNKVGILEDSGNFEDMEDRFKNTSCMRAAQTVKTCADNAIKECPRCRNQPVENADQRIASSTQRNVTVCNSYRSCVDL